MINPNLDAVTEAKIALQQYDAEMGKAVAGYVTAQTKSGSNDFHGSAFWFRRTDANQARDPFTQFAPDPTTGATFPPASGRSSADRSAARSSRTSCSSSATTRGTQSDTGITNTLHAFRRRRCRARAARPRAFCDLSQYLGQTGGGGNSQVLQGQVFDPDHWQPARQRAHSVCRQPDSQQHDLAPGARHPGVVPAAQRGRAIRRHA